MVFNLVSPTLAVLSNSKRQKLSRRLLGLIFTSFVLLFSLFLYRQPYTVLIAWSLAALLAWHLLFVRRTIVFDLERKQITTEVSSVYTLAMQVISIEGITALQFLQSTKRGETRAYYEIHAVLKNQTETIRLEFGSKDLMLELVKQISDFTNIPWVDN
ncbi:hypothetical protein EXU30_07255 [Shewanella maritima]|uniref:Uncharacterized protein n=1 Tax=Shewanella maritima TaxID=2520507 RepID=A0A411PFZ3_9GAMM|nr:hypothetical protein [Shewanella maritima]QBF82516.1 hypothetical protein EXU30_07255 [Shewanella maritima]